MTSTRNYDSIVAPSGQPVEVRLGDCIVQTQSRTDDILGQATERFSEHLALPSHDGLGTYSDVLARFGQVAVQMVNALCEQLAVTDLGHPPERDEPAQLQYLAEVCRASYETLRACYESWRAFLNLVISANTYYEEDRREVQVSDVRSNRIWGGTDMEGDPERARAANRAEKARQAAEELASKTFKELKLPPFPSLAHPWLTHERVEGKPIAELYQEAPGAFRQMVTRAVIAFLQAVEAGLKAGVFGKISAGRLSAEYSFTTFRIIDRLQTELISERPIPGEAYNHVVATTQGTRTISRVSHVHQLLQLTCFSAEAALKSPALQLPARYRRVLQQAPHEIRPHLTAVFGTQTSEVACARDIDSEEVVDELVIARQLACEPCVCLAGRIVLFGWGKEIMNQTSEMYSEHRAILDQERKHLDDAARARGSFWTTMRFGIGLIGLLAIEALIAISTGSLAGVFLLLPVLVFAVSALYFAIRHTRRHWKHGLAQAQTVMEEGFEMLTHKYAGFDPDHAQLRGPDDAADHTTPNRERA